MRACTRAYKYSDECMDVLSGVFIGFTLYPVFFFVCLDFTRDKIYIFILAT